MKTNEQTTNKYTKIIFQSLRKHYLFSRGSIVEYSFKTDTMQK